MAAYRCGIDIGSTTVKLVVLDRDGNIIYGQYRRHLARTRQTLNELLSDAEKTLGDFCVDARITGSGAISLAKALDIKFVQEVVAVRIEFFLLRVSCGFSTFISSFTPSFVGSHGMLLSPQARLSRTANRSVRSPLLTSRACLLIAA